jgi:sulfur-oxidizing protein SoxA
VNRRRPAALRRTAALAALTALAALLARDAAAQEPRRSGYDFMSRETRAMQDDDMANPGMLSVLEGGDLWAKRSGAANRACADCHGADATAMDGVAARYPAFDSTRGQAIDLAGRIRACSAEHQQAEPPARESRTLLALTAFVAHRSRGMPVTTGADPRLGPSIAAGRALWQTRLGQLNLSCAQCHDDNAGQRLGSAPIPEAHPTGYPIYRLEWQDLGSLQRRIRGCLTGVRAEPFAYGADAYVSLEAFLMDRARGMPMETPGVRP